MDSSPEKTVDLFRALGDLSRLRVLAYLLAGPRYVSEIVRSLPMKQSLVSHHLGVLKQCGLVRAQRNGPFVLYEVSKPEVHELLALAGDLVRENGSG